MSLKLSKITLIAFVVLITAPLWSDIPIKTGNEVVDTTVVAVNKMVKEIKDDNLRSLVIVIVSICAVILIIFYYLIKRIGKTDASQSSSCRGANCPADPKQINELILSIGKLRGRFDDYKKDRQDSDSDIEKINHNLSKLENMPKDVKDLEKNYTEMNLQQKDLNYGVKKTLENQGVFKKTVEDINVALNALGEWVAGLND